MLTLLAALAHAADAPAEPTGPVDLGVLKNSDLRVVQKVLYTKEKRTELGASLGVMPFDGFTVAPQLTGSFAVHPSDKLGLQVQVGGGYGLKTARYVLLESATYGVAVEAYRYLASAEAGVEYTPIYAKMNLGNGVIVHHDVYALLGVGATLEQSVLPSGEIAVAPTVPVGVGARVFLNPNTALKVEFRDNLMYEYRAQSATGAFKQNAVVSAGLSMFGKAKR